MGRLKRIVGKVYDARHKLGDVWRFATRKRSKKIRFRRFRAARSWARDHWHLAGNKERRRKFGKALRTYRRKVRHLQRKPAPKAPSGTGTTTIDGRQVANWIAANVLKVRAAGRWKGTVVSGYRSPAYSRSLCYSMCGAPSCPGRCAGEASNHSGDSFPRGAVDVTDYWTFGAECRRLGLPLTNHLPSDPVHYSNSGY